MSRRASNIWAGVFVLLTVLVNVRGVLANESTAIYAVENIGWTDVTVVEHHYILVTVRGCGTDAAMFVVRGKRADGKDAETNVCVGWPFKGATVRF